MKSKLIMVLSLMMPGVQVIGLNFVDIVFVDDIVVDDGGDVVVMITSSLDSNLFTVLPILQAAECT